jgi:hypothetical protein
MESERINLNNTDREDPTQVVGTALENGVSVAGIVLSSEATLTEIPSKQAKRRLHTHRQKCEIRASIA